MKEPKLRCPICGGGTMFPTEARTFSCSDCEMEFSQRLKRCVCGGDVEQAEFSRWVCDFCESTLIRELPQKVINRNIDRESAARLRGMIRGGRSQSGRTRKKKIVKRPWYIDYRD